MTPRQLNLYTSPERALERAVTSLAVVAVVAWRFRVLAPGWVAERAGSVRRRVAGRRAA